MTTTEDNTPEEKKLDVAKAYTDYSTGKTTINQVADEHNMPAMKVAEAFEAHVQSTKGKQK